MAAINEIALRSPVAAVNSNSSLRIYQLANDGGVREAIYEGGWSGGGSKNTVGHVKLTSPLAATALPGLSKIRVYGVDQDNTIKEIAYDSGSGWYTGGLSGKFTVAPYSGVAAVFLANKAKIRVYVQSTDNTIQEYSYDEGSGWYKDQNLGPALPGTSISVVTWGKTESEIGLRVYFQDEKLNVIEKAHDANSKWYNGALNFSTTVPRVSLASVAWGQSEHIRVYYGTFDDQVAEKGIDAPNGWYDGGFTQPSVPGSKIGALTVGGSDLRVYLQKGTQVTAFTEFAYTGTWVVGESALPPAA